MRTLVLLFVIVAFVAPCAHARAWEPAGAHAKPLKKSPRKRLRAFRSERELKKFLRQVARAQARREAAWTGSGTAALAAAPSVKDAADASSAATPSAGAAVKSAGAPAESADESVTNVQHAGVDEGGIVKLHGNYLVVLRRGRLFTIDISGGALRPVSSLDAFGPDIEDAESAW